MGLSSIIKSSSDHDRGRLGNDMLVGFCDCFFFERNVDYGEAINNMRLPVELDPSFPRGRFRGSVHCTSTGAPLASAKIRLQGFQPVLDNFFGIHQVGETDRKGRFDLPAVPVGTYYAFATLPGYVSPASLLPTTSCFGVRTHFDVPDRVLDATLPKVTINVQDASVVDFQLETGGSISGRVSWQDGTPARNNWTQLMLVDAEGGRRNLGSFLEDRSFVRDYATFGTDAEGNFRFKCLPPGRYIIGARVPRLLDYVCKNAYPGRTPAMVNCASLYYWTGGTGGTPYYMEAVPLELQSREDISGISIVLPMLEREP
jgi:hypothetical protein